MENAPKVYTREDVEVLRQTVAQGATDAELRMFVEMAKATGLNPFKREIWFIKANGRVQMMTGINGFYSIANNSQSYDGIEVGLVGKDGEYLQLTYPGHDFIGAWAKVYRKDRRIPTEGVAMLAEYDKGHGNWKSMRRIMITKCAESIALRKAFPQELNGLYTQEEMPTDFAPTKQQVETARESVKAIIKQEFEPEKAAGTVVYAIPYSAADARKKLAQLQFTPDKSQKPWHWKGSVVVPELAEYRVDHPLDASDVSLEEDEIVFDDEPALPYPAELAEIEVNWEE